jgi:hypothetical protein
MEQHPGQRPREVLEAYLSRVGNKTFEGSCIFHQPGGCSLPREMRSDTCDRYFCSGLAGYRAGLSGEKPPRAFFVSVSGDAIRAAAFCDQDSAREVEVSSTVETDP